MTDHVGSTSAHHYSHTKFRHCSPYRTLYICLFFFWLLLLANQKRYATEVLNICIRWRQTTWVVLVSTTTHIPSFTKIGHCVHTKVYLFCWNVDEKPLSSIHPSIHTYIQTDRQRDNKNLSGPSSIAGGPQLLKTICFLRISIIIRFLPPPWDNCLISFSCMVTQTAFFINLFF